MSVQNEDGWCEVTSVMMEQAQLWQNAGPVRTQNDMSEEEIRKIEEQYCCAVQLGNEIETRKPIESYAYDSWHKIRKREKARRLGLPCVA
tara:strand:+ start:204 stop:473 length:270 start_codon:yes stop_codon:yes gene_type:complete